MPYALLAEVVRSGFVESRHVGSLIGLAADGTTAFAYGEPAEPMLPRSASKPLQAAAMVRLGLELPPDLLALAAASHSGEDFHQQGALRILRGVGLDADALQNPIDRPLQEEVRLAAAARGDAPSRLAMNCSGKHAAMLATCVVNGWPAASYLDPAHPLQEAIEQVVVELAGEPVSLHTTDGCGAPLLAISTLGLARAFRALTLAAAGSAERHVVDAIRQYPQWTSGTTRSEAALVRGVPGLVVKMGAECVYAGALDDGRAFAFKVQDGSVRAYPVLAAAALRRLGVESPALAATGTSVLLGGDRPVGEVRAAF